MALQVFTPLGAGTHDRRIGSCLSDHDYFCNYHDNNCNFHDYNCNFHDCKCNFHDYKCNFHDYKCNFHDYNCNYGYDSRALCPDCFESYPHTYVQVRCQGTRGQNTLQETLFFMATNNCT
jgi:hypothetical protein